MFAYALLQKYQGVRLALENASVVAYKVLEEAIAVGTYGLGPPIDIWHITKEGISQVPEDRKAAIEDAARSLRQAEVKLLTGGDGA
ncbi:MAG: hypothetical protein C4316_13225 [Chloroflexota bacterium]|mgnify:FL=1